MENLPRFDPATIPDRALCVFIGPQSTAMYSVLKDVLRHKHISTGVVFSPTVEGRGLLSDSAPSVPVYPEYNNDALTQLISTRRAREGKTCVIIADGCMHSRASVRNNSDIRNVHLNNCQFGFLTLITTEHCRDMCPVLCMNAGYVFICGDHIEETRVVYDKCFRIFPSHKLFEDALATCREGECLVYDRRLAQGRVFVYKGSAAK